MTLLKTTKQSPDYSWYAKWCGSICILLAIGVRGAGLSVDADILLSMLGTICWTYVAISWKDRAMMMMNIAAFIFLLPKTVQLFTILF